MIRFQKSLLILCMLPAFLLQQQAAYSGDAPEEFPLPDIFFEYDPASEIEVAYDDVTFLLRTHVMLSGNDERAKAPRSVAPIGTRFKAKRNLLTVLEGNKFYFDAFKDENRRTYLTAVRKSLERLPREIPLNQLNRREQLAYWLNLYNVTVLEQIVNNPRKNLNRTIVGDDSLLDKKLLNVAGIPLSLNDIEYRILAPNYKGEPLVIYGLYQGYIGSPSIRKKAYTGETVYRDLEKNAVEFINSNRGTYFRGGVFRVSGFYKRNKVFFSDFQHDLKKHINQYIESPYWERLQEADTLKANINDWMIASVFGDNRDYGGAVSTNHAALFDSFIAGGAGGLVLGDYVMNQAENNGVLSLDQAKMLKHLNDMRLKNTGIVTVEEIQRKDIEE
ncbi:DUF547 domain-containing protein [Emcibacter nanhaiensis]|uniref:DUF547 domain-containing protein n=1 Tax=Emcibacter nanhaiensis TaxID=1505037 RepID=A0A501PQA8_9PROT|nr:DUF547 domain-containing protein [Emcibacter nanhaiensis]TPD62633.1 DUF547 domain-containing protein [Emcibacter nanhaiensis]